MTKKINRMRNILGWYQLLGGIAGIAMLTWLTLGISHFSPLLVLALAVAFLLFLFSMHCGTLLMSNARKGINLSMVNQCLQVIGFFYGGYAFLYNSGLYIRLQLDLTDHFDMLFGFGISNCQFNIAIDEPRKAILVNLVPVAVIWLLEKIKADMKSEATMALLNDMPPSGKSGAAGQ